MVANTRARTAEDRRSARNELVEEHLAFARNLAHRLRVRLPSTVDVEELESDAYLGLLKAAESFDAERGVLFRTYASRRINGEMIDGLREREGCRLRQPKPHLLSLDALVYDDEGRSTTLAEQIPDDAEPVGQALEMREEAELILEQLQPASRQYLIDHCVHGVEQKEIAATLGITPSATSQRLKTIRKQVEAIRCRCGR